MYVRTGKYKFPAIDAMSGWGHTENQVVINGRDWTQEVMDLAAIVGHYLPTDDRDQGVKGQFNASHADKQLVEERLKEAIPPIILRMANIIVSSSVCADCDEFIKKVNTVLDLNLQLRHV